MNLDEFLQLLERSAPLALAETWDNVGLLLAPRQTRSLRRVLFTIDLTLAVAEEAVAQDVELVVAYHPPIFSGCKRIVPSDPSGRMLLTLLENRIAVYSPHTALDAVDGGVNDWLARAFDFEDSLAIVPKGELVQQAGHPRIGQGRKLSLARPQALSELLHGLKRHLALDQVRVAGDVAPEDAMVRTIALCPGAGASVVQAVRADLYLTGEMRHHDVLALCASGASVVLTEHTNSERGFLQEFVARLSEQLSTPVELLLAATDRDPLRPF